MASHASISKLARNIRRPDIPVWLPRTQGLVPHLGFLTGVDTGRNVVDYLWNHPSGDITAGVPYLQTYSATHQPAEGDLAQLMQYGNMTWIAGHVVAPDGVIIVP